MKPENIPPAKLVTVEVAAQMLSISRSQVYVLFRDGHLESVKIGRSRRIPVAALIACIEELRSAA